MARAASTGLSREAYRSGSEPPDLAHSSSEKGAFAEATQAAVDTGGLAQQLPILEGEPGPAGTSGGSEVRNRPALPCSLGSQKEVSPPRPRKDVWGGRGTARRWAQPQAGSSGLASRACFHGLTVRAQLAISGCPTPLHIAALDITFQTAFQGTRGKLTWCQPRRVPSEPQDIARSQGGNSGPRSHHTDVNWCGVNYGNERSRAYPCIYETRVPGHSAITPQGPRGAAEAPASSLCLLRDAPSSNLGDEAQSPAWLGWGRGWKPGSSPRAPGLMTPRALLLSPKHPGKQVLSPFPPDRRVP